MKRLTKSHLTLLEKLGTDKWGCMYGLYRCTCGNTKRIRVNGVKSGRVKACGCRGAHLMRKDRLYHIWQGMVNRSHKQLSPNKCYKGISLDSSWLDFDVFFADMKNGYADNLTIDRIDNSLGYSKENCRWATRTQQSRNRGYNHTLTLHGQTFCIGEWAEKLNIKPKTLYNRIQNGWSTEKALTTPVRKQLNC